MLLNIPSHPDLRKIVVLNPKGGSGKSTIATNLAGYIAHTGHPVALMDFDPQGSAMRWLHNRPLDRPDIHGIAAYQQNNTMTRSWQLRVPGEIRHIVIDTPAALQVHDIAEFTRGAHAILVPVLPSDIDIHAASRLIADMLVVAKVSRRMGRLGVVANRVRENTVGYRKLNRFLERLSISVVGELRDSQNYVHAADHGLSVGEMLKSRAHKDQKSWNSIIRWLEDRVETPITPRDLYRPTDSANEPEINTAGDATPAYALPSD